MVQDKQLSTPKEKTNWQKLFWAGKLLITLLILSYIYKTFLNEQKGIGDIRSVYEQILNEKNLLTLLAVLFLVPVNWALESLKWQILARKAVPITFREAFRGTLTGLAVGVAAPAQLGDTIGRVAALKSDHRLKAIGAAIISNGIQFYVSLIFGGLGLIRTGDRIGIDTHGKLLLYSLLMVLILLGMLIISFRQRITNWQPQKPFAKKILSYFQIIGAYTKTDLLIATLYGTLRYIVFLSQFLIVLSLFNFQLSLGELSSCVALIFLAKTLIPAINVLGDLGLREFTALFVFKQYNLPPEQIIAATFLVWIVNVLGPILIGIFLIWKYKWKAAR